MAREHNAHANIRISSMYQSSDQGYPVYPSHETTIQILFQPVAMSAYISHPRKQSTRCFTRHIGGKDLKSPP